MAVFVIALHSSGRLPMDMVGNASDMAVVGAATAADHPQVRDLFVKAEVKVAELVGVAVVEDFRNVQFGMAEPGRIRPKAAEALQPIFAGARQIAEVIRVRTVDHVVKRCVARCGVGGPDGVGQ
jgi:hypothetical protein